MHDITANQLNTGQTGGPAGRDINVVPAWMQGFTGKELSWQWWMMVG